MPIFSFFGYSLDEQSSARCARSATYRLTVFFIIEIPFLPITFRYSLDEQSSARFARSAAYRLTVFFIIEIHCLSLGFSIFAGRAEPRSLRSCRHLSVDNIFIIEMQCLLISFRISPGEQSSARSASYRLTVFFITEIPCLSARFSNFAGRAELRSLRSLRCLSVDGIFHNRDTFVTYHFSIFDRRAEPSYLSVDGILHNRDTLPIYSFFDIRWTSRAPLAPLPIG